MEGKGNSEAGKAGSWESSYYSPVQVEGGNLGVEKLMLCLWLPLAFTIMYLMHDMSPAFLFLSPFLGFGPTLAFV